jgi:hypothetical protein
MLRSKRAQAILELAVLGSILITVFAIAIDRSENAARSLGIKMRAFRSALKAAAASGSGSVSLTESLRMPNINTPMEPGQLQIFSGSGSATWSNIEHPGGGAGTTPPSTPGPSYEEGTTTTSGTGASSNLNYKTTFVKDEVGGKIVTRKILEVWNADTGKLLYTRTRNLE